ncbi:MAG: S41 family peptidase [Bacteroidales bacterium]|nr:S41 family peptidase [Bacteroidales bacterium]
MKRFMITAVTLLLLLLQGRADAQSANFKIGKSLDVQINVLKELSLLYVDSIDSEKLIMKAIDAMLESLDPYTVMIPAEDKESLELLTTGSYGGIGALIRKEGSSVLLSEVYENTPASKAGLFAGDMIVKIDGISVTPLRVDECSAKMKGTPGTSVTFKIIKLRGGDTTDIVIVREKIHIPDVAYSGMLSDSVGYIRITGFTIGGAKDVKNALIELKKSPHLNRLIIDLRGNGGGLLDEAVDVVSLFVPKGTKVVSSLGKFRQADIEYHTKSEPVDINLPLVILVNSSSASSSEIVAGALQDLDRATIVGTRTFGKGLVQSIRDVGYNNKIKVTTAKYYTPSGRCVQAIDYAQRNEDGSIGVIPDSLIRPFKTLVKGRTVYDGGGIIPDVRLEPQIFSRLAVAMVFEEIIHDYSIEYFKNREGIESPSKFSLTDKEFEDFVQWASSKEFDYRTASEVEFDKLLLTAKRELIYDGMKDEIAQLEKKLKLGKTDVLRRAVNEIKPLLEEEIVSRYYFQRGRIESMLRNDIQATKALDVKLIE